MSDNERTCGTCGCFMPHGEFSVEGGGECRARPPSRRSVAHPGFVASPSHFSYPLVMEDSWCRHDWVPRAPAELPQETKDALDKAFVDVDAIEPTPCSDMSSFLIAGLSGHARSTLRRAGITTVNELAGFAEEDAASLKGAGPAVMAEFRLLLKANGLSFREAAPTPETT